MRWALPAGAALQELVTQNVQGSSLLCHAGAEIIFRLPKAASGSFASMLRDLEAQRDSLSVSSYGLGMTTLEEVGGSAALILPTPSCATLSCVLGWQRR